MRRFETKLLRQFDSGFASSSGLASVPVVYPGIGATGFTPNPGFITNTVVRPQGGGSGGGGGGFGSAIIGSIIGSALATIIPAILRPRLAAAVLRGK